MSSSKTLKSGKESNVISIDIAGVGGYKGASGGERRKADLAIQLGIVELAKSFGCSVNVLTCDEVLDTLDESSTRVVLDILEEVGRVRKVFLVSHSLFASPSISSNIVVEKRNGVSSILENV